MSKLIFSFDTEDYINPHAADGIIRVSRMIREAGYTPCHNIVGWLIPALKKWGREDVLDELRKCEIGTHSLKHSYHPTICEYTDIEDFDEAMRLFRKEEDEALEIIRKELGNESFYFACPPGQSWSYVASYGYADMGIPIYTDGLAFDAKLCRPVCFCNIISLYYNCSFDCFTTISKENIYDYIEKMADNEIWIFYHHPAKNTTDIFTDVKNFKGKNWDGEPILSDMLPDEQIKNFEENLRFFLDVIKKDKRFKVTSYKGIAEQYSSYRVVKPKHIKELRRAIDAELFPVTVPESLSLSDIMLACRDFLLGKEEHVCEKVYGFLDTPYAVPQPVKITKADLVDSCLQIKDTHFLPTLINVGDKVIGPADWLRAALAILDGSEVFTVVPDKWQIDLNEFPRLRDIEFKKGNTWDNTWIIHSDTLKDNYLSTRARLQSWTIRLPKGTQRKIF